VFASDVDNYQGYFIKFQSWLEHTPFYYCSLFFFKYYKQVFGFHIFSIFLLGSASNIVSSPRQEYAASDHVHFMDEVEVAVVKSLHCNDIVSEQDKATADSNVTGMFSFFVTYNT
jgi:hypothetical protein